MVVPFSMLLNLASASSAENKAQMWGFMNKYAPEASAETHPGLDAAAEQAVRYFHDFVKPEKQYRAATEQEYSALKELADKLRNWDGETELQSLVFAVGKAHGFDPLRDWFKAIYEVLLGASQGPRFGGFIALYGVPETVALIEKALNGELVNS
jgi:lysyl-tRNA synthetase class 1